MKVLKAFIRLWAMYAARAILYPRVIKAQNKNHEELKRFVFQRLSENPIAEGGYLATGRYPLTSFYYIVYEDGTRSEGLVLLVVSQFIDGEKVKYGLQFAENFGRGFHELDYKSREEFEEEVWRRIKNLVKK